MRSQVASYSVCNWWLPPVEDLTKPEDGPVEVEDIKWKKETGHGSEAQWPSNQIKTGEYQCKVLTKLYTDYEEIAFIALCTITRIIDIILV